MANEIKNPEPLPSAPAERLRGLDGQFVEKPFDWNRLDWALALGADMNEAMGFMELSEMTITNKIRQRYDMTFAEYRDIRLTARKMSLRRKMWEAAEAGNVTAMIWLSKNMLGMTDKFSAEVEVNTKTITFNYSIPGNRYLQKKPDVVIDQGGSNGTKIED